MRCNTQYTTSQFGYSTKFSLTKPLLEGSFGRYAALFLWKPLLTCKARCACRPTSKAEFFLITASFAVAFSDEEYGAGPTKLSITGSMKSPWKSPKNTTQKNILKKKKKKKKTCLLIRFGGNNLSDNDTPYYTHHIITYYTIYAYTYYSCEWSSQHTMSLPSDFAIQYWFFLQIDLSSLVPPRSTCNTCHVNLKCR